MTAGRAGAGSVVIDLSALCQAGASGRRISGYARDFVMALEHHRPDLVGRYLLPSGCRLSGDLAGLLSTKIATVAEAGSIPESARVFHAMSPLDPARPLTEIWPPEIEHLGLVFSATVYDVRPPRRPPQPTERRQERRYRARCEVLRQADALLATSSVTKRHLVELLGVDPAAVTVVGSGEPWEEVVARSGEIFEALAARGRRPWRTRVRVAFVSPFPPIASGVARYSSRLVEALAGELDALGPGGQIDCFADGRDRVPDEPAFPAGRGESFDARRFPQVERAVGGYDRVVYVLGNSEFHSGALVALRQRSGTVMAHDVRMTGLLRHSLGRRGALPAGLVRAARGALDEAVPEASGTGAARQADIEQLGRSLTAEVVSRADQLLVSSEAARHLVADAVGPELARRVRVLPFAMALDSAEAETVAAVRAESTRARPLVVSFGIVDPSKLPRLLLEAVAAVRPERELDLAFVGPVSDALALELFTHAAALGIRDRLQITGHVERSAYLAYLARATVAVQLRAGFSGEASAAVADCLAAGVATVVSDVGWMGDLPADTVAKVDSSARDAAQVLAETVRSLLDDPGGRAAMSARAAEFAARQTFARSATALVAALGLGDATG